MKSTIGIIILTISSVIVASIILTSTVSYTAIKLNEKESNAKKQNIPIDVCVGDEESSCTSSNSVYVVDHALCAT